MNKPTDEELFKLEFSVVDDYHSAARESKFDGESSQTFEFGSGGCKPTPRIGAGHESQPNRL